MLNSFRSRFPTLSIYLFLLYFSLVPQLLVAFSAYSSTLGIRDAILMTSLWLLPIVAWPSQAKVISAVIGAVCCLGSLGSLGYWLIYQQEFSQSVFFIAMESNTAEATEFISSYMCWWYPLAYLVYIVPPFLFWGKIATPQLRYRSRVSIAILSALALLVPFLKTALSGGVSAGIRHLGDRLEPTTPWSVVVGFIKYREQLAAMQALLHRAQAIKPLAKLTESNADMKKTVVLVLGESQNRQRMGLYGYGRPTTPLLDNLHRNQPESLYVFDDVITPRPYTIEALQQALSFADSKDMSRLFDRPNLLQMMKQAGYHITWITNQQTQTKRNTMLTTLSQFADQQIYLNNNRRQNAEQYDGVVLEPFTRTLTEDTSRKRLLIIHLLGAHRKYHFRYPTEYQQFNGRDAKVPHWVPEGALTEYNSYDNAILYNDMIVFSLIDRLKLVQQSAMLTYFADHGEDVFDSPEALFAGRDEASPTPPMYTVPFIVWVNDHYRQHRDTTPWKSYTGRSFSIADFIYTWADLIGLDFDGMDSSRSLVSKEYQPHPRWIGAPETPKALRDYDQFF